MQKREIKQRDYILFSQILTEQRIVRRFRLNTFKEFLREGRIDEIEPVLAISIETPSYVGYRVIDGNHRCRSAYDMGQPGIWAYIAEPYSPWESTMKSGHGIDKLEVVDEVIDDDIKYSKWRDRFRR